MVYMSLQDGYSIEEAYMATTRSEVRIIPILHCAQGIAGKGYSKSATLRMYLTVVLPTQTMCASSACTVTGGYVSREYTCTA